jgi:hypothetical protein
MKIAYARTDANTIPEGGNNRTPSKYIPFHRIEVSSLGQTADGKQYVSMRHPKPRMNIQKTNRTKYTPIDAQPVANHFFNCRKPKNRSVNSGFASLAAFKSSMCKPPSKGKVKTARNTQFTYGSGIFIHTNRRHIKIENPPNSIAGYRLKSVQPSLSACSGPITSGFI